MKVALMGLPGAGKSVVGRVLAAELGVPFVDLDDEVSREAGSEPGHLIDSLGLDAFRAVEHRILSRVSGEHDGLLALGGGSLDDPRNAALLRGWRLLWLRPSLTTLVRRLSGDDSRPLLRGNLGVRLDDIDLRRRPVFARSAEAVFAAEAAPPAVAREIARYLQEVEWVGPGVLWGRGSRHHLGRFAPGRAGVVVAATLLRQWGTEISRALPDVPVLPFDDHEEKKTLDSVRALYRWAADQAFDRTTTIYAVGGGVTVDVAGFLAATYLRGLPLVDVPTTLLAAVDASIGGKVGVDLPEGKNLVGAFHTPRITVVDPEFWASLPPPVLADAMAEIVKAALLEGEEALEALEEMAWPATPEDLEPVARRALAVKMAIVEADPREEAERTYLNLGHTVGHALEQATGYQLSHGHAVAIGLVAILRYGAPDGRQDGLVRRVEQLLVRFGLPIYSEVSPERLLQPMGLDKKRSDGGKRLVLLERPGHPYLAAATDQDLLNLASQVRIE